MTATNTSPVNSAERAPADTFTCPKCGHVNPPSADFCIQCHNTLVFHCPKCWHAQRHSGVCDNCGLNMIIFAEAALERTMEEEDRVWWERFYARTATFMQLLFLPFAGPLGILRSLFVRIATRMLSRK